MVDPFAKTSTMIAIGNKTSKYDRRMVLLSAIMSARVERGPLIRGYSIRMLTARCLAVVASFTRLSIMREASFMNIEIVLIIIMSPL